MVGSRATGIGVRGVVSVPGTLLSEGATSIGWRDLVVIGIASLSLVEANFESGVEVRSLLPGGPEKKNES